VNLGRGGVGGASAPCPNVEPPLTTTVVQILSTSDRAGLVDNAFTAARLGLVDYGVALELAQYLSDDDDQTPWKAFANNVRYIDDMMMNSAYYPHWQVGSTVMIQLCDSY